MNDYRVVPSMKQGSYSYAPSIKREKGAPCGNSHLATPLLREWDHLKQSPSTYHYSETGGTFQ